VATENEFLDAACVEIQRLGVLEFLCIDDGYRGYVVNLVTAASE
jgi:hypothetical protein